jgi:hypothetical protein
MMRLQLRIYTTPGEAQLYCNLLRKDGAQETITATIDTGAAISLFPAELLEIVVHHTSTQQTIDQAGIANQSFTAIEAYITISLEDEFGNLTPSFEIPAWFAASTTPLVGFAGLLDRSILHIDMPNRNGWLDL